MDEYRNIDVAQCKTLGMHILTNQIPDDLETMERDTIYIHIPDTLLPQWKKEIEISTDGSLVRAGSEEAREAAAFITHRIEAEFGIAIDEILSLTKAEAKAVLLALKAVPYRCKLTINTDSQAVMTTAQRWLSKDSPLSIKNQLKTSNWHTWNAIRVIIREKRIDLNMNKVANKLAKRSTTLDTVRWAYNAKETAYIPVCGEVELDLNIRHFLNKQASLQSALDWIGNNKVQETIGSLDQDIDWICTTKIWNWDKKMSSGFISAGSSAMCTFIMKSFHNMLPTAEVLYNRHFHVYLNNLCKTCHREVETNQHFWECSLNTQEGKTLIDDVKDKWIQCLSEAVKRGRETHNTDEKIILSNEYIMSTSNIDLLCKGLINKQFGRINAFSDIDLKTSNNILIKVCIDNRVKRNPTVGSSIHSTSRNSGKDNGKPIVKIGDVSTQCNGILTNVFCGRSTLYNSVIPHRFFGYTSM
ncbi:hypothetical protein G9A89_003588 [Geosiphon pyriformis]|nr:hypothetical protein G9A89_003588 [Geosiphon pyriformis]